MSLITAHKPFAKPYAFSWIWGFSLSDLKDRLSHQTYYIWNAYKSFPFQGGTQWPNELTSYLKMLLKFTYFHEMPQNWAERINAYITLFLIPLTLSQWYFIENCLNLKRKILNEIVEIIKKKAMRCLLEDDYCDGNIRL